jgi:pimeloyl-ACP methyl ester carboxylesterase
MTVKKKARKYITPLHMNKMHGRMMRLPPKNKRKEILLVYGHHASLERMYGFADYLNRYGAVTVPDLPGFGGMESFYKIGREPTIDSMADYLASFIKLQYKRRRVTIVAMSFSVPVVTRMLQKYPSITKKVDMFVSYVGFVRKDDFSLRRRYIWGLYALALIFSLRLPAAIVRTFFLKRFFLNRALSVAQLINPTLPRSNEIRKKEIKDFDVELWQINDFRTRFKTIKEMLSLDLCNKKVPLPVHQIAVKNDVYFDHKVVEQHMRIIFSDFELIETDIKAHSPSILAEAKEIAKIVPNRAKQLLRSS